MDNIIQGNGKIMKRMVKESTLGLTVIITKADIKMGSEMGSEKCSMAMERSTKAIGKLD